MADNDIKLTGANAEELAEMDPVIPEEFRPDEPKPEQAAGEAQAAQAAAGQPVEPPQPEAQAAEAQAEPQPQGYNGADPFVNMHQAPQYPPPPPVHNGRRPGPPPPGSNPPPYMPPPPPEKPKVRRVGLITMGVCMIAFGVLLTLGALVPHFNFTFVLRFAPVALVVLGVEILYNAARYRDEQIKLDVLSFLASLALIGCSTLVAAFAQAVYYI